MLPYRDSRLTRIVLIVFFIIVVAYAYYEGRGLLYGPSIEISGGLQEVHERFITIEGHATRIASLSMNGRQISVTEEGDFSEPFVLAPGYNRIVLEARDRYGKTTERAIEIVYSPPSGSLPLRSASSTESASTTVPIAP